LLQHENPTKPPKQHKSDYQNNNFNSKKELNGIPKELQKQQK
jgi:hypothetical protein